MATKARLAAMMFLQYAIWGAWAPVLWPHLSGTLGLSESATGWVFSLLWLACLAAPFTGGQLADRWVRTELFLAVAHLAGGAVLLVLATLHARGADAVAPWLAWMGVYSLLFAPTLALTNSLALRHLAHERDFGRVRVFGTVGWIGSGLFLTAWRSGAFGAMPEWITTDAMFIAGALSVAMGLYCFTLPKTPPSRSEDPLAFRKAFVLLRDPAVRMFLLIAFVVTTELQFYYGPTGGFLESALAIDHARVPAVMAVAQAAEIVAMAALLPWSMRRFGLRATLALGVIAWPLRYVVFAFAPLGPLAVMRPLVIGSLTLHGVGFSFFFVASQVFIDRVAPRDIRASAQALLTMITLGLGNFLGTLFTAGVMDHFTTGGVTRWTPVFLVPCLVTVACAVAFFALFREPAAQPAVSPTQPTR